MSGPGIQRYSQEHYGDTTGGLELTLAGDWQSIHPVRGAGLHLNAGVAHLEVLVRAERALPGVDGCRHADERCDDLPEGPELPPQALLGLTGEPPGSQPPQELLPVGEPGQETGDSPALSSSGPSAASTRSLTSRSKMSLCCGSVRMSLHLHPGRPQAASRLPPAYHHTTGVGNLRLTLGRGLTATLRISILFLEDGTSSPRKEVPAAGGQDAALHPAGQTGDTCILLQMGPDIGRDSNIQLLLLPVDGVDHVLNRGIPSGKWGKLAAKPMKGSTPHRPSPASGIYQEQAIPGVAGTTNVRDRLPLWARHGVGWRPDCWLIL